MVLPGNDEFVMNHAYRQIVNKVLSPGVSWHAISWIGIMHIFCVEKT